MLATLAIDTPANEAEIILIATRGTVPADDTTLFGRTGQDIGNAVLVARLFHIAIAYARAARLSALTNRPFNPRLARKYERMGFINGARLPLDNSTQITKAFAYVADVYAGVSSAAHQLTLALPPPPL